MKDRAFEIFDFLVHKNWDGAIQTPLQADFSTRRFARLEREGADPPRAILMDADPDQKTAQFVTIAGILRAAGLSAPEIYAANVPANLVLMEDFGDRNLGRLIDAGHDRKVFCRRGMEALALLHRQVDVTSLHASDLPHFDARLFAEQARLFLDGYFLLAKKRLANAEEAESFDAAWLQALAPINQWPQTLMLRDFMLDNLMELPRDGIASIGLLDFQDGGIGPFAYDIASLCEVVRRDGAIGFLDELADFYHAKAAPKFTIAELRTACRLLAAQRHTRILGIVARLALKTGRSEKLAYAPRIWNYLDTLLAEEKLKPVRDWMQKHIPAQQRMLNA